jgi:catalase
MILFSDRGTPDGFHQMHGYSGHTYKFVKEDGDFVYVQVHIRADKGFKVWCVFKVVLFNAEYVADS